jgi:hypothetical protein
VREQKYLLYMDKWLLSVSLELSSADDLDRSSPTELRQSYASVFLSHAFIFAFVNICVASLHSSFRVCTCDTAVCSRSLQFCETRVSFDILSSVVISIAPRDTAPPLLEDVRWIKPFPCFEATERA